MVLEFFADDTDSWPILLLISRKWYRIGRAMFDLKKLQPWQLFYNRESIALHIMSANVDLILTAARCQNQKQCITWVGPVAIRTMMQFADGRPRTTFSLHQWINIVSRTLSFLNWRELIELLNHIPSSADFHSVTKITSRESLLYKSFLNAVTTGNWKGHYFSSNGFVYAAMICSTLNRFHAASAQILLEKVDKNRSLVRLIVVFLLHFPIIKWPGEIESLISGEKWEQIVTLAKERHSLCSA